MNLQCGTGTNWYAAESSIPDIPSCIRSNLGGDFERVLSYFVVNTVPRVSRPDPRLLSYPNQLRPGRSTIDQALLTNIAGKNALVSYNDLAVEAGIQEKQVWKILPRFHANSLV